MPVSHARLSSLLLLAATLLGAGAAHAAVPFTDFGPSGAAARTAPVFAKDGAGAVYGAWTDAAQGPIVVGKVPPGATAFAEVTPLPGPIDPAEPEATLDSAPVLAADGAGGLTLAWSASSPSGTAVLTATRRAGEAAFSAPVRVAGPADSPSAPLLGMSDDGSALINWTNSSTQQEWGALRRGIAGAFSAPVTLLTSGPAESVDVGADGTMAVAGVRTEPNAGSTYDTAITEVVRKPPASDAFGPVEDVASGTAWPSITASVAVGPDGRVWAHQENSTDASEQKLFVAAPGQPFQAACTIYARTLDAPRSGGLTWGGPAYWAADQLRVDLQRSATDPCNSLTNIGATVLVPTGSTIADLVVGDAPSAVHAAWTESAGSTRRVQAAYVRTPVPAWATPTPAVETLATDATFLQDATADAAGNALLSWDTAGGPRVALVDHEPPEITAVDLPAELVAGAPLPLRATVRDTYSAPVKVHWTIAGRGNQAPVALDGESVTFQPADAKAGIATVTVDATDAAGNTTRTQRSVTWRRAPAAVQPVDPKLTLSAARFRAARASAPLDERRASKRRGVKLTITASAPSTATFRLERLVPGRRSGRRCRATAHRGKRCVIARALDGAVTRQLPAGRTTLRFTGRWDGQPLPPGRYRLTAVVTTNRATSPASRATFRILASASTRRP